MRKLLSAILLTILSCLLFSCATYENTKQSFSKVCSRDIAALGIKDAYELEQFFLAHNPKVDKAMRDIFDGVYPQSLLEVKVGELMLPAFPPAFECALLVGHMVNHVYAEGLGMRQVVDFMIFLQKEHDTIKTDDCRRYLKMMRMERAFRIFACLCEDALGMSHELLGLRYSFKEKKFANKLLADILKVGNFGRGADYLGQNRFLVPIKSYFWVFGRCVTLGYLCPAEARWWPVSKLYRYCWKKRNHSYKF